MGLKLEMFISRILKSADKKQLLSLAVIDRSVSHIPDRLTFDVEEEVVQKVANVLAKLIVQVSEIPAVCCVISVGVIKSCHISLS